jgi:hypothetical protein
MKIGSEQSAAALSMVACGVVVIDAGGRVTAANPSAGRILGFAPDDLVGLSWLDPPWEVLREDRSPLPPGPNPVEVCLRTLEPVSGFIMGLRGADGRTAWISVGVRAVVEEGQKASVVVGMSDATLPKVTEERWKLAVEGARDGIWDWNAEADRVFYSRRWKEMIGYEDHEIGESRTEWEDRLHPDDKVSVLAAIGDHLEARSPYYEAEYRLRCKDGSWKWIRGRGAVVSRDTGGRALRFVGAQTDVTERKRAEEALQESEERYKALFDRSLDCVYLADFEGNFLDANQAALDLLGYQRDEIQTLNFASLLPPDQLALARRATEELRTTGRQLNRTEFRLQGKDGAPVHVETQSSVIFREGRPWAVQGIARDITGRKRAEEALREATEHLLNIVKCIPDTIWSIDLSGRFTYISPSVARTHGWSVEECLAQTVRELNTPRQTELNDALLGAELERALSPGYDRSKVITFESEQLRKDGSTFWAEIRASLIWSDDGKPVGVTGITRDITERRSAELRLRESEDRFRSLSTASMEAIMVHSRGVILDVNAQFVRLFGYDTPEELIGRNGLDFMMTPDSAARIWRRIQESDAGPFEITCIRKDGSTFAAETDSRPLLYRGQEAVIASCRDITERRLSEANQEKLRAQLTQAQKMESIGRLAGGVAHDFNNLLTVINGYSQLALNALNTGDPLRRQLEEILKAGGRASELTRQLLAFSRKQLMQPRRLDLNRVVEGLQSMLQRLVGEDVEARFALTPDTPVVQADPHQLEQVILNLVVNARDAMPKGGRLLIETARVNRDAGSSTRNPEAGPGPYAMLAVSDTGAGMDEATRQRIFEPFFTTKPAGEGTGLGLSMVQGIVAQSGGYIEVYSEPGNGTTFKVYLPALDAPAEAGARTGTEAVRGGKETILVVEDQADVREYAAAVLRQYGYHVILAANAGEALLACERTPIHLVLTDVVMPHVGGRELAARLERARPELKVLFMSGYTDNVILHHEHLEANGQFVQKPFTPVELAAKVRQVLGPPPAARILVADDVAGVRAFLRELLEQGGYEVLEAADGSEALTRALAERADLAIIDLVMPEREGIETIRSLRRQAPDMGIIAISGAFGGKFLKAASLLGADALLAKPVSADELLDRVADVLERRPPGGSSARV